MCYTQAMSFWLATACFAVAWYEYRTFKCLQYSLGLAYFGLMEMLQAVQHSWLAVPEDDYAMCKNPMNQFLTFLGGLHICYQPLFVNMVFSGHFRRTNVRDRIESDLIQKLCILGGTWIISRYFYAILWPDNPALAPVATEACPNYEWVQTGYDPHMNFTTPNLPGHSCTYKSPSKEGHLAWAMPLYQVTYMVPSTSLHFFLMFAPYLWMTRRPLLQFFAALLCLGGPLGHSQQTPHLNEQPAIWCFFSVFQCVGGVVLFRCFRVYQHEVPAKVVIPAGLGEEDLAYYVHVGDHDSSDNQDQDVGDKNGVAAAKPLLAAAAKSGSGTTKK